MKNWRVGLASLVFALLGCTKPNPKSCIDGTCTTEQYPFCDVDGSFAGEPQTCIAVDCEPNAFAQCRGDDALSCNAAGTDYDTTQCPLGCQDGVGCRVCQPNETVCANGAVQTCDAGGNVVASEPCALGCFEDEPRCRNIDPSNGLAKYVDMAPTPLDLDLSGGGSIHTQDGKVFDDQGAPVDVPSFLMPAPSGGVAVRVFVVKRLVLGNVDISDGAFDAFGPAVAFVARDTVKLTGNVNLSFDFNDDRAFGVAGGMIDPSCIGGPAQHESGFRNQQHYAGSGGGGHATAGGHGGGIDMMLNGGVGGLSSGAPSLIPLRGGCAGGGIGATFAGGMGGGAIQIVSNVGISFDTNASINANGSVGLVEQGGPMPDLGGGAGGGILLEAPAISLGSAARLLVNGGPGPSGDNAQGTPSLSTAVALGGVCATSSQLFVCTNGGNGATGEGGATSAPDMGISNTDGATQRGGAGGGGLGFIRINTGTGEYQGSSAAIVSGSTSTGTIRTR